MSDNCTNCDPPDWLVAQIKGEKCPICGMEVNEKFLFQEGQWFCSASCLNAFQTKKKMEKGLASPDQVGVGGVGEGGDING